MKVNRNGRLETVEVTAADEPKESNRPREDQTEKLTKLVSRASSIPSRERNMKRNERHFSVLVAVICSGLVLLSANSALAGHRHHKGKGHRAYHQGKGRIGKLLLTKGKNTAICRASLSASGLLRRYYAPVFVDNHVVSGPQLLPGGIFLMGCRRQLSGPPELMVAYDLFKRRVRWMKRLNRSARYGTTNRHLFKFFSRVTPPHDLQGRTVRRFVAAYSIRTGKLTWRSINPALGYADSDPRFLGVPIEGPASLIGSPEQVVLSYLGTSAYDATTGALLWATPIKFYSQASGSYAGSNTVIVYGRENNDPSEISGVDPLTQSVKWNLYLPFECLAEKSEVVGSVQWEFGDDFFGNSCIVAYDLLTGQSIIAESLPNSGGHAAISRNGVVEWNNGQLAYYSLSDLSTPIWSEPAGEADPVVVGSGHVLLENRAGTFVVNLANGKIRARVLRGWVGNGPETGPIEGPVDGLVASTHEDWYSTVLRLDRR